MAGKIYPGEGGVYENDPAPYSEPATPEAPDPTFGATPAASPAPPTVASPGRSDYNVTSNWYRGAVGWEVRITALAQVGTIDVFEVQLNGGRQMVPRPEPNTVSHSVALHQAGQFPGQNSLQVTVNGFNWFWSWD